jgi:hypothetical protein
MTEPGISLRIGKKVVSHWPSAIALAGLSVARNGGVVHN